MGLTDVGLELGKDLLGPVRELGDFIRAQRTQAQISLRALADKAGVSNPYLSQVERGLRRPSAAILTQIADGLSISAETLLAKAGILRPHESKSAALDAIRADSRLTERQKASLIEIYRAFVRESMLPGGGDGSLGDSGSGSNGSDGRSGSDSDDRGGNGRGGDSDGGPDQDPDPDPDPDPDQQDGSPAALSKEQR